MSYGDLEEQQCREEFNAAHGEYLPIAVCLSMTNLPVRWQVVAEPSDLEDKLPEITPDILAEVKPASAP